MAMKISGTYRTREKDGTQKVLARVFTDAVKANGVVPDEVAFSNVAEDAVEQTKDRNDIDGVIFFPMDDDK